MHYTNEYKLVLTLEHKKVSVAKTVFPRHHQEHVIKKAGMD